MEGAIIFFGLWVIGACKGWSDITNRRGWICSRFSEETVNSLNENPAKKFILALVLAYFIIGAAIIKFVLSVALHITDGF